MIIRAMTTVALALVCTQSVAARSASLLPSGRWSVGYEERLCTLSRKYGPADKETTLILRPYIGDAGEQFGLVVPARKSRQILRGKGQIVLSPSGRSFDVTFAIGPLPASATRDGVNIFLYHETVRRELPNTTEISFATGNFRTRLQLTDVSSALKALKACQDDLLRNWKVDPDLVIDNSKESNIGKLFGVGVYPKDAFRRNATGEVIVVIDVESVGKPAACRVVASSSDSTLDENTCRIVMERATFVRDLDRVRRYSVARVTYTIS